MNDTLPLTDPRSSFAHAVITARAVIDGVRPDQFELPTPCTEKNVRSLLGHMLVVFDRIAALGNGDDPMAMPDEITGVADDEWPARFLDAAHRVQAAWTDDAKLAHLRQVRATAATDQRQFAQATAEIDVPV